MENPEMRGLFLTFSRAPFIDIYIYISSRLPNQKKKKRFLVCFLNAFFHTLLFSADNFFKCLPAQLSQAWTTESVFKWAFYKNTINSFYFNYITSCNFTIHIKNVTQNH